MGTICHSSKRNSPVYFWRRDSFSTCGQWEVTMRASLNRCGSRLSSFVGIRSKTKMESHQRKMSRVVILLYSYMGNTKASVQSDLHMSRVIRKPTFCVCENKDAGQLRGNREADQRFCFRYIDRAISLLSKTEISSL